MSFAKGGYIIVNYVPSGFRCISDICTSSSIKFVSLDLYLCLNSANRLLNYDLWGVEIILRFYTMVGNSDTPNVFKHSQRIWKDRFVE